MAMLRKKQPNSVAADKDRRESVVHRWLRHITEAAESYKTREGRNKRPDHPPSAPEPRDDVIEDPLDNQNQNANDGVRINDVNDMQEITERPDMTVLAATSPDAKPGAEYQMGAGTASEGEGEDGDDSATSAASASATSQGTPTLPGIGTSPSPQRRFQRVEILQIAEGPPLIEPSEVVISEGAVLQTAEPVLAPIEKLRRQEKVIKAALDEKRSLVAEILHIPRDELELLSDITTNEDGEKSAKELVAAVMAQVTRLTDLINESLTVTEEDAISAGSEGPNVDGGIAVTSTQNGSVSPRLPSPKPGRKACRMPTAPVHILLNINSALSVHMMQLLALVTEREEERERLRKEVRASREQIHMLHEARRRTPVSQSPSHSRPNSFISMSSSTSELGDGTDHLHGEDDHAIPSTLEAYNKLVNQPTFIIGGMTHLCDDHNADVSGEDLTIELFVDAPSESCTDDASTNCASEGDEEAGRPPDVSETEPSPNAGERSNDSMAPAEPVTANVERNPCVECGKEPPLQPGLDTTNAKECEAVF